MGGIEVPEAKSNKEKLLILMQMYESSQDRLSRSRIDRLTSQGWLGDDLLPLGTKVIFAVVADGGIRR